MASSTLKLEVRILDGVIVDELLEAMDAIPEPWRTRVSEILRRWLAEHEPRALPENVAAVELTVVDHKAIAREVLDDYLEALADGSGLTALRPCLPDLAELAVKAGLKAAR